MLIENKTFIQTNTNTRNKFLQQSPASALCILQLAALIITAVSKIHETIDITAKIGIIFIFDILMRFNIEFCLSCTYILKVFCCHK